MSRPLGSVPTSRQQGLLSYYGSVRRRVTHRYSVPSVFCLGTLPLVDRRATGPLTDRQYRHSPSHVPCKTCRPGSRRLYAEHRLANRRAPARLIPGKGQESPVSMSPFKVTTPQQRRPPGFPRSGASGTSSWSPPDAIKRTFSLSLTTTVFSQRSTGWFDACPRRPTSEGHTSISCTASLPKDLLHSSSFCVRDALSHFAGPV
jgi:hypothetical protein